MYHTFSLLFFLLPVLCSRSVKTRLDHMDCRGRRQACCGCHPHCAGYAQLCGKTKRYPFPSSSCSSALRRDFIHGPAMSNCNLAFLQENIKHMYKAYGGWSFALKDYYDLNVTAEVFHSPAFILRVPRLFPRSSASLMSLQMDCLNGVETVSDLYLN